MEFGGQGSNTTLTVIDGTHTVLNVTELSFTGATVADGGGGIASITITAGVSSVSNSDGTLTISPTTGAVVASLNLANANTWTALQTFTAANSTTVGLVVKGAASQSANLQQWQKSTGSPYAWLDSTGGYHYDPALVGSNGSIYFESTHGITFANTWGLYDANELRVDASPLNLNSHGGNEIRMGTKLTFYNNIQTAGWGVPAIYGYGRLTAQTGAVASVAAYTVGAADGSFIVSGNINMTAFTAGSVSIVITYTDEGNTARSLTMNLSSVAGVLGTTAGAAGAFEGVPLHIRAKASTAITVTTTVAGFTGTYNVEGAIQQIA